MAQHYSDPKRASDPHALPDVEVFQARVGVCDEGHDQPFNSASKYGCVVEGCDSLDVADRGKEGWFYWFCLPGCLPDSDPTGPFETEQEALEDAREGLED